MRINQKNNIALLFGAGISLPSKMPSTTSITNKILSGDGIVRGTAENYFFGDTTKFSYDPYQDFIPRITTFLNVLKKELQVDDDRSHRPVNYEDIYYLVDFIRKNIYGTEKNPAFKYLLRNFESAIKELSSPIDSFINDKVSLQTLLNETIRYMEYSIISSLSKKPENFDGLTLLRNIISDSRWHTIDLFTLNHDLVIEKFLDSIRCDFCDGFGAQIEGFRFWDQVLYKSDNRINLYKLHGSIDWFYYDETSWEDRRICKCTSDILWRDPRKPEILIGTYNKLAEYIKSIYLEMFYRFYNTLNRQSYLIISGYSFGDKGINEKIIEWIYSGNKRMIIIDPFVDTLKDKIPTSLFRIWSDKHRVVQINNSIEKIALSNIDVYLS